MALKAFQDSLASSSLSPSSMFMMNCLCAIFTTHGVITKAGEFMTVGQVAVHQEHVVILKISSEIYSFVDFQ